MAWDHVGSGVLTSESCSAERIDSGAKEGGILFLLTVTPFEDVGLGVLCKCDSPGIELILGV